MKTGIDIIDILEFKQKLQNGGQSFLNRHFSLDEQKNKNTESLAGIFAAKEAVFKTGLLKQMDFLKIQILKNSAGRPEVYDSNGNKIKNLDISISHTKTTAIAIATWNS